LIVSSSNPIAYYGPNAGDVIQLNLMPDGYSFVSITQDRNYTMRHWNATTRALIATYNTGHTATVNDVAVFSNGIVATGSSDQSIKVWNLKTNSLIKTINFSSFVTAVLAMPGMTSTLCPVATNEYAVYLVDYMTSVSLRKYTGHYAAIDSLALLFDGTFLSVSDSSIRQYSVDTGTQLRIFSGHTDIITAVSVLPASAFASVFTSDGTKFVTSSYDSFIKIWKIPSSTSLRVIYAHEDVVFALQALPNQQLLSCSYDQTVNIIDINTGSISFSFLSGIQVTVSAVLPGSDGVILGGTRAALAFYDILKGEMIRNFTGHSSEITSLLVLSDQTFVCTDFDFNIFQWNYTTGALVKRLSDFYQKDQFVVYYMLRLSDDSFLLVCF
jgi:WD40 repeat protein